MPFSIDRYKEEITTDIVDCIKRMGCQPILFVGSGLTIRHCNGPSWPGLLSELADQCPEIDYPADFYIQNTESMIDVGTEFADKYNKWAWRERKNEFPDELFTPKYSKEIYLKYRIASILKAKVEGIVPKLTNEIDAMKMIRPHSLITTNYDSMIESIFPEYTTIIGQEILKTSYTSIGEIFKIHGCVSDPSSIIITRKDYDDFIKKKKYLSAKLLTFFLEHPILFIGYSAGDINIQGILADIDEVLSDEGALIKNVYFLEWSHGVEPTAPPPREKVIKVSENRGIRVNYIYSNDYSWVYRAFSSNPSINNVDPKVLRALLARMYDLVRRDIPKKVGHFDYKILTKASTDTASLATLFGITKSGDHGKFNIENPYSATLIAEEFGLKNADSVLKIIKKIENEKGINIKATDNIYHTAIMHRGKVQTRKYSLAFVELLRKVVNGEPYELELHND